MGRNNVNKIWIERKRLQQWEGKGLRRMLLLHEILGVVQVALMQHHLSEFFQFLACLHVINEVHQKLDSALIFNKLAVFLGVNLK